jgi:glycosyltransferase involved in cell wall biosynthesis
MKDILIDVYKAVNPHTGLGQISINYIEALKSINLPDINITLLTPHRFEIVNESGFNYIEADFRHRYFSNLTRKFDLWHSLHQFPSHYPNKNTKQILTVHDLNFLVEKNERKAAAYLRKLQKNVDRADAVTAISNSTRTALESNIDLKGRPVRTIYNGVKLDFKLPGTRPKYLEKGRFFLAIGVFREKKNFEVLLPMMKYIDNYRLIIAGDNRSNYGARIKEQAEALGLAGRVILPGKVSDEEKSWLYRNCEAFMMPSLAEGFGLPVIEAMLAKRPVFLNSIDALQEIGGDVAYYFKNFNDREMAKFVKSKLVEFNSNNSNQSDQLASHASKFSWESCIEEYLKLYVEIMDG